MLLDPCRAPLVPGAFGNRDTRITRVTSEFSLSTVANGSANVVWMPKYHCEPSFGTPANLFSFNTSLASDSSIQNTTTIPWGAAPAAGYNAHNDPAAHLVYSSRVRDARTIAACMEIQYIGRNDSEAGAVTGVAQLRLSSIWRQAAGIYSMAPYTYDDMFGQGDSDNRPAAGARVVYKPSFASNDFIPWNHSPVTCGTVGIASTVVDEEHVISEDPAMLVIAIRGASDPQDYVIRVTKIIEYRENDLIEGITSSSAASATVANPPIQRAVQKLDKKLTGWQSFSEGAARAFSLATSPAARQFYSQGMSAMRALSGELPYAALPGL